MGTIRGWSLAPTRAANRGQSPVLCMDHQGLGWGRGRENDVPGGHQGQGPRSIPDARGGFKGIRIFYMLHTMAFGLNIVNINIL